MVGDSYNWLWNNPLTREVARCPKVVGDLLRSGYGKVIRDRTRVTVLSRNFSSSGDFLFLFRHESIIVETFIIIFNPDTYRGKLLMYFVSLCCNLVLRFNHDKRCVIVLFWKMERKSRESQILM